MFQRHYSANACLLPICSLHGAAVTTVEGVGSTKTRIHPVQVRVQYHCIEGLLISFLDGMALVTELLGHRNLIRWLFSLLNDKRGQHWFLVVASSRLMTWLMMDLTLILTV